MLKRPGTWPLPAHELFLRNQFFEPHRALSLTAQARQTEEVRPGRLELPRTMRSTRPSTLRVYQFRHRRVVAAIIGADGPPLDVVRQAGDSANTRSETRPRRPAPRT